MPGSARASHSGGGPRSFLAVRRGRSSVRGGAPLRARAAVRTFVVGAASLLLVLLGALALLAPASIAYACPACYGLARVAPGLHVERGAPAEDVRALREDVGEARDRVAAFYGGRTAEPTILACHGEACDARLGGTGARAQAFGARFVHLSPRGWSGTILAHELAHIELHARIGFRAMALETLPAWFDEGLAVIVSRDGRHLDFSEDGSIVCRATPDGALPETRAAWGREAGSGGRPLYAMAACRVAGWLEAEGGAPAVLALVDRLHAGGSFEG